MEFKEGSNATTEWSRLHPVYHVYASLMIDTFGLFYIVQILYYL